VTRWASGVGLVIRAARMSHGLTQKQLAHLAGMHQTAISRIECGDRHCGVEELADIADALKVDPVELFKAAVAAVRSRHD
jgi:transcriptional regulator with XRE-family HTH domain